VLAGVGAVALLAAAAFASTRPLGPPSASSSPAFFPFASSVEGVGVGQRAPEFVSADGARDLLTDVDGRPIRIADYAGRPVWIVFWATTCPPCDAEAPDILAAYHAHVDDGLVVLAVDVQEPVAAARTFAAERHLDYTIGVDASGEAALLYGGWGLPTHVFVDRDGVVRDRSFGEMNAQLMEEHLASIIGQ
jgi:peroxiredoxin